MAATIDIIGVGGSSTNVVIESASVRRFELMKEDYIRLVFSSDKKINIRLGDSITHELWGTFYITEAQKPTYNRETGGYDYDLQFNAPYYKWNNKLYKFEPKTNRNEASWSLTDNLKNHMAVFLRNLEHYGWSYTVDAGSYELEEAERTVFIQFDNIYILDALTKIAEAFNVEWWITDNIIHFGRVESGTAIDFEVGVNVESMDAQSSEKDAITRFYAFGSSQNVPSGYRKNDEQVLLNGVVQKRIMLPADTPYIDIEDGLASDEIVEGIVIFDEVYPRTKSKISEVIEVEKTVEKNNSTAEATTDTDATPAADEETEKVKIYRFKTEDFTFSENYILAGQTLQVKFESGKLNGMTFDLAFNPEGKSEKITVKDGDGTKEIDNPEAQLFEIVRNDMYGLMLPNETLKPSADDDFILLGWDANKMEAWKELVSRAEQELKTKAKAFAEKKRIDPLTYPCTMMADYMYGLNNGQQDPNFSKVGTFPLGQRIRLNNAVYFKGGSRVSRVVGYEYKLDIPYDGAVIIVGESATYSSSRATEAAINAATDSINYRGGEFSQAGGGGNVYIITSNDATAPSEGNVYSALRSDRQYARKNRNDNISSLWTFKNRNGMRNGLQTEDYNGNGANEDNLFGKGFELISKPDGNGGFKTKLEVDELFVRIKAFFARLEIREISYVGGNYCFSAAGSKIYYVEWLDASGNVIDKKKGSISDVATFRCYLYSDDGTTATINKWAVDDQIMCRTFNIDEGVHENVSNKYYWRRGTGIGRGVIPSQVKEEVELQDGDEIIETNDVPPTEYQYVDISMDDCATNSDYPEAEDTIVQFGNWSDAKRQGIIYLMVEGDSAPAIMEYSGVGANGKHFVLPDPTLLLSPKKNIIYGEFHSVVDSGGSTGSGDSIDDQLRALIDALNDIKNQADKKMEMWFGSYEPLPRLGRMDEANYPASEWTTDALKALHAQDLFYDTLKAPATQRGRAWRWIAGLDENNNVIYYWEDVTDQDTIDALEKIADVASDGKLTGGAEKTRVFIDWQKAVQEYLKYKEQARDYGITTELTDYVTAFKALGKLLNDGNDLVTSDTMTNIPTPSWLADLGTETVIPSPTDYREKWNNYYTTLAALLKEITKKAKELADAAQQTADEAIDLIGDIASDGRLDPSEKITIKREFTAAFHEKNDTDEAGYKSGILDRASYIDEYGIRVYIIDYQNIIIPYINAFVNVGTYLNGGTVWQEPTLANFGDATLPAWLKSANMKNTEDINADTFRSIWNTFYSRRTAVLTALSEHAQDTADNAHDRIDDVVSDGILSGGAEKSSVFLQWQKAVQEYLKYTKQAGEYSVSATAYVTAYTALATMLNGNATISESILDGTTRPAWLSSTNILTDTKLADYNLTADQYRGKWNDYYVQFTLFIEAIGDKVKSLADEALEELDNMAEDNILTEFEKLQCLREWDAAKAECTSLVASVANIPNVSSTALSNAFNILSNYLNNKSKNNTTAFTGTAPALLITSGNTEIDGSVFKQYWRDYYNARSSLLASSSSSKVSVFVQSSRPTPPYKAGDLWIQTNNDNNMMICIVSRNAGATGYDSDWADLGDLTEKRDPRILIAALVNMVYTYNGGYIREKGNNAYEMIYLGIMPSAGHAQGDLAYANGNVYQYTDVWENVSNETLRMSFKALHEVIGDYNIRIFRTRPTSVTPQLYDIVCSPITFTETLSNTTLEGGIQIQMYNGSDWEVLQESTRGLIENLGKQLRFLMFGSDENVISASGLITQKNISKLFAQATDTNGKIITQAYLEAYTEDFVDENGVKSIVSGLRFSADKIDFEGKVFTIGAEHIALSGTDDISLMINGVKSDLANTGINIQEGKITLNANNTIISGNLSLTDPDKGVVIYDSYGNPKVSILNNTIGTLESYDLGGDKRVSDVKTKSRTSTSQKIQADFSLSLGSFSSGQTLKLHDMVISALHKDHPFDTTISTITYTYNIKCGDNVITTKSGTASRKTAGFDYDGFSIPDYTNNSVSYNGEYILNVSCEVTLSGTSLSWLGDYRVRIYCLCRKILANIIQIATDGAMFASSNVAYNWFGSDKTQLRNGAAGIRLKNGRIQRNVSTAETPTWNENWGDISTMAPLEIVNDLTYTATENDGFIVFSTVIGSSDGDKRTLTLPNPSNLRGKVYYIKNIAGDNTEIRCVNSDSLTPPNSSGYSNTVSIGNKSAIAVCCGFSWVIFYCG